MKHRVEILNRERAFDRFFRIDEVTLRHERYDGTMSGEMKRLLLDRGDSVALLLMDRERNEVLFCEQFRLPTMRDGQTGWLVELPAGMLEEGEDPANCARREAFEETGYEVEELQKIASVFLSPGGTSEKIHLYYGEVSKSNRAGSGGGVLSEHENIKSTWVPAEDAMRQATNGDIADAKTLIALQWLQLRSAGR